MQSHVERWTLVVQRTDPIIGPQPEPPAMPSDEDEMIRLQARVAVLGSHEANDALERFAKKANEFRYANATYQTLLAQHATNGLAEAGERREELRGAVRTELLAMADLFRRELGQP